jgi:hypothetical protein
MKLAVIESAEMLAFLQGLYNSGALIIAVTPRGLNREPKTRSTDYAVVSFNVYYVAAGSR